MELKAKQKEQEKLYNDVSVKFYNTVDLLAILQKSLDRALFLHNFILEARSNGVKDSITITHIRKFFKLHHNIVRFRFFPSIAKWSIPTVTFNKHCWRCCFGVVMQWCNHLTLKPEQSGVMVSIPCRTPPLKRHDKGSQTRLGLFSFFDPSTWRGKTQLRVHLHLHQFQALSN